MLELDKPQFTLGQIAKASAISPSTIRTWFQRGQLRLGLHDKASPQNGMARLFSGSTAIMVAVASKLNQMGIDIERAAEIAIDFAYIGDSSREPGCLIKGDDVVDTLLILSADEEVHSSAILLPRRINTSLLEVLNSEICGQNGTEGVTILALFNLVNRVRGSLGLPSDNME